jgi:hypothetical protein
MLLKLCSPILNNLQATSKLALLYHTTLSVERQPSHVEIQQMVNPSIMPIHLGFFFLCSFPLMQALVCPGYKQPWPISGALTSSLMDQLSYYYQYCQGLSYYATLLFSNDILASLRGIRSSKFAYLASRAAL